ncbi:hypothetical protein STVIR_5125 [Streptomyces viridochromogenes Tue57]|uniref:Uncharacterized protein n=1 Tax=Streptomyces viridochromogenes Tue57 TaxID=1160705 RepID=L8P8H0_STRVR|nr:hypothetical protein STVIR_5125 [Streptomyces viridochromogenes Tue57]
MGPTRAIGLELRVAHDDTLQRRGPFRAHRT